MKTTTIVAIVAGIAVLGIIAYMALRPAKKPDADTGSMLAAPTPTDNAWAKYSYYPA